MINDYNYSRSGLCILNKFTNYRLCEVNEALKSIFLVSFECLLHSHFSLPLKEKLSLGNVESILKHVRERIENGGECSLKEINTLPLCQYLLNEEEINEVTNTLPLCQYFSCVMRKPAFCLCENKDADQLRSDREADQCLCFRYTDSTIPLLLNSGISSL